MSIFLTCYHQRWLCKVFPSSGWQPRHSSRPKWRTMLFPFVWDHPGKENARNETQTQQSSTQPTVQDRPLHSSFMFGIKTKTQQRNCCKSVCPAVFSSWPKLQDTLTCSMCTILAILAMQTKSPPHVSGRWFHRLTEVSWAFMLTGLMSFLYWHCDENKPTI